MGVQEELIQILSALGSFAAASDLELYIVGGIPRNLLYKVIWKGETVPFLSRAVHQQFSEGIGASQQCPKGIGTDIDLLINTAAEIWISSIKEEFKSMTGRSLRIEEAYKPFQTVKVKIEGLELYNIEFASARTERYPEAAAFPVVSLTNNIREDIPRRDFTINALLIALHKNFGELIDYSSLGVSDMKNGLIRAFHANSFIDDPTRIYRAFRFALEYGFEIEPETALWIKAALKDERFPQWFKKRKNRFLIELAKYRSLIPGTSAEHSSLGVVD